MQDIDKVAPTLIATRVFIVMGLAFIMFYLTVKLIGPENKEKWFKKRAKYTFFNRRGLFGEDINFGYPRTPQGFAIAIVLYGIILGGGFWYVFMLGY